jgi:hypothetical protein
MTNPKEGHGEKPSVPSDSLMWEDKLGAVFDLDLRSVKSETNRISNGDRFPEKGYGKKCAMSIAKACVVTDDERSGGLADTAGCDEDLVRIKVERSLERPGRIVGKTTLEFIESGSTRGVDCDAICAWILTKDLESLINNPVKLARTTVTTAKDDYPILQRLKNGRNYLLLASSPFQIVVFLKSSEAHSSKLNIQHALKRRGNVIINCSSPESNALASKEKTCDVDVFVRALLDCKIDFVRMYLFGQKQQLSRAVAIYGTAINSASKALNRSVENTYDFGKTYADKKENQAGIWSFGVKKKKRNVKHVIVYPLYGDGAGSLDITLNVESRKITVKVYPILTHFLKTSAARWSTVPKNKKALLGRMYSLELLFSTMVADIEPTILWGYRVEATVVGGSMEDASRTIEKLNILSLTGLSRFVEIEVKEFSLEEYFTSLYDCLHWAFWDMEILDGGSAKSLNSNEKQIYAVVCTQLGLHFGKKEWKLFTRLHSIQKICRCNGPQSQNNEGDISKETVEIDENVRDPEQALRNTDNWLSLKTTTHDLLSQMYREALVSAGFKIFKSKKVSEMIVLHDVVRHVQIFMRMKRKKTAEPALKKRKSNAFRSKNSIRAEPNEEAGMYRLKNEVGRWTGACYRNLHELITAVADEGASWRDSYACIKSETRTPWREGKDRAIYDIACKLEKSISLRLFTHPIRDFHYFDLGRRVQRNYIELKKRKARNRSKKASSTVTQAGEKSKHRLKDMFRKGNYRQYVAFCINRRQRRLMKAMIVRSMSDTNRIDTEYLETVLSQGVLTSSDNGVNAIESPNSVSRYNNKSGVVKDELAKATFQSSRGSKAQKLEIKDECNSSKRRESAPHFSSTQVHNYARNPWHLSRHNLTLVEKVKIFANSIQKQLTLDYVLFYERLSSMSTTWLCREK